MALDSVKTKNGSVRGLPCGNPAYTVFKAIPYAKPPVDALRWKAPEEADAWEGIREAVRFSPASLQPSRSPGEFYAKEFFPVDQPVSEDSLYLNIWTPAETGTEKLPVMFWIHGGAFVQGFGHEMEFDGEAFCRRGVILVTFNYRLGILGFFAHPDLTACDGYSGNYAVLDTIAALTWVRNNIAAFGGDRNNVTVFGQSAGGAMVNALVTSPLARGLFHKAILQSGENVKAIGYMPSLADAEEAGKNICVYAGKTLAQLRSAPAAELLEIFLGYAKQQPGGLMFSPCVDGHVLPEEPGKAVRAGRHADIPYMLGTVGGDGSLFSRETNEDKRKADAMLGPRLWGRIQQKLGRSPAYVYLFNREMPGDNAGAFHSSELWYIFGTIHRCWRPLTGADYALSLIISDYWTNFAKTGDPNGKDLPSWQAFTAEKPCTMVLNEKNVESVDLSGIPYLTELEAAAL